MGHLQTVPLFITAKISNEYYFLLWQDWIYVYRLFHCILQLKLAIHITFHCISSTFINFSSFSSIFSQKLMGSRTLFSKLMGLTEPIEPMLTQPLHTYIFGSYKKHLKICSSKATILQSIAENNVGNFANQLEETPIIQGC